MTLIVDLVCDCGNYMHKDHATGVWSQQHAVQVDTSHHTKLECKCGKKHWLQPNNQKVTITAL